MKGAGDRLRGCGWTALGGLQRGLRKPTLPPSVKAGNCSRVWREGLAFRRAGSPPRSPPGRKRSGLRPQAEPCPRPSPAAALPAPASQRRLGPGPAPAGRTTPPGGRRGDVPARACVGGEGERTRKLRNRRASRGRESAELPGRGWDRLHRRRGAGGLLGEGAGCRTAPRLRGRARRSSRSIRQEGEDPQGFKGEESAAEWQNLSGPCRGWGAAAFTLGRPGSLGGTLL